MAVAAQADMTQFNTSPLASEEDSTDVQEETSSRTFYGSQRNMVTGIALLGSSVMAFMMGMTDLFFTEAWAWTFGIWGALLLYTNLLDVYQMYQVNEDNLFIDNPLRPWDAKKTWEWDNISRYEIVVNRHEAEAQDAIQRVYHSLPGEIAIEREDRAYDPELAREIIERAGLNPAAADNPSDLDNLPQGKATYLWH